MWSECARYTFLGRACTFRGISKGNNDPRGKQVRNAGQHLLPPWGSHASVKDPTGLSPSPVTPPDSLWWPEYFHVCQTSRISVLITGLLSALSSWLTILGSPAPWKHPEAIAARIEGLSPGSWQAARHLKPGGSCYTGLPVTGQAGVSGTQWWTCVVSHTPRSMVTAWH